MALDASNVSVAGDGIVAVGALTATAPTGLGALPAGFTDLGYISEDGVTESTDQSVEKIKAWQRNAVVRSVVTEGESTFSFTLIETKKETVELAFGVTIAGDGSYVKDAGAERPHRSFIIDVVDGGRQERSYIPYGQVTELGEVTRVNGEPVGYEVTITAFNSDAIGGSVKVWDSALGAVIPGASPTAWAASTFYPTDATVTVAGGTLEATEDGTSGATAPTAPATVGGTVQDGTVLWTRIA